MEDSKFREMRRAGQRLSDAAAEAILERGTHGILACHGDAGYPYAVPLSYVYTAGRIYFHSAKSGHKIDAIFGNPRVSFAVVDEDRIVSAEYTSYFRSAIAFGSARTAEGEEWTEAFMLLVEKYAGGRPEEEKASQVANCGRSLIIAIDIEHLRGKEAIELVRMRQDRHPPQPNHPQP